MAVTDWVIQHNHELSILDELVNTKVLAPDQSQMDTVSQAMKSSNNNDSEEQKWIY